MSNYKIVDADTLDSNLKDIADHIRTKGDTTDTLSFPQGFMDAVDAISTGGGEEVLNSLIDRSITEIKANVASVGDYAFYYCNTLTSVDLPVCISVGDYAFYYCRKLTSADLQACTSVGSYAFNSCNSLTSVDLPVCTSVGSYAFSSCISLTSVDLQACTSVGSYAFSSCRKLTSADLQVCTSVGSYAFSSCYGLTSVDLQACTSVGSSAFNSCNSLTSVDLPVCTSVGSYAFYYCRKLTSLILRSESLCSLSNTNAFTTTPIASGTGYIYVPKALIDTYKTATNWVTYANQFRALEDYTVDGTTTGALDESKI